MAVSRSGAKPRKYPKTMRNTAMPKMSAGPVEDLAAQNKARNERTGSKKLVKAGQPTPPQIPPQPFAPQAGARVPV